MNLNFFKKSVERKLLGVLTIFLIIGFGSLAFVNAWMSKSNMIVQSKQKAELMGISLTSSIQNMMLTGNAAIVGEWAQGLKNIKAVNSVEVIRNNGEEAFLDNTTIEEINDEMGDDIYDLRRGEIKTIKVQLNESKFQEAINTGNSVTYFEEGGEFLTTLMPIIKTDECYICHTNEEKVRGIIKIVSPMKQINSMIAKNNWSIIIISCIVIIVVVGILAILIRKITVKPIIKVVGEAQKVADGDLTTGKENGSTLSEDEVGSLARAFGKMRANLTHIVKDIQDGGLQISSASNQILASSEEQARSSESESSSVAEVTSTIEELSRTANQIAENSSSVVNTAEETLKAVATGQSAVAAAHKGMDDIMRKTQDSTKKIVSLGEKSRQIGEVVNIINEIAVETKMLSLNAAIEASRAGEAGKGFSVVAVEIRKLAENVVKSTTTIKSIIEEIQSYTSASVMATEENMKGAESGVVLVNKVNDSLKEIMGMSEQCMEISQQISSATHQQRGASEQVVTAMKEISNSAKQNAATAKESSAAVGQINTLAINMKNLVGKFKVDGVD